MNSVCNTRMAFHCQPAQHLLIDVGHPMTPTISKIVLRAVENVITLASSLYGGVRIPGFGLSFINTSYCNVLKTVQVRGNLPKILKSFKSFEDMIKSNETSTFQEFMDNLKLAIYKILEDYGSKQDLNTSSQEKPQFILITLVTLRDGFKIQKNLEELLNSLPTEKLRKIHILQINVNDTAVNDTKIGVLVDLNQMQLHNFKLEQFFKNWLLDCDTSQEYIRIHFYNTEKKCSRITIKCDVVESMINPFLLPFSHFYQIQTDYFKGSGIIKFPAKHIPVYDLTILNRISGSGLCESFLFGQSHRLSPTKCWQMEGHESIINQQYFYSLCKQLSDKDEYLLAVCTYQEGNLNIPGHYVLIPGAQTLLLRAVTPSELVLPIGKFESICTNVELPTKIIDDVNFAFSKLTVVDDFMPDMISSNLYQHLRGNLTQKNEWYDETSVKAMAVDHPALNSPRKKLCLTKKRRLL